MNAGFVKRQLPKTNIIVAISVFMRINYNDFINFVLTILFFVFATRQMFLYNDIIGTLFLFFLGLSLALYNGD